jgi:hypothetical protein
MKVFTIAVALMFAQVAWADESALLSNLERLERLEFEDFHELGDRIIGHEENITITGLMEGRLVAGYNLYLRTDPEGKPEITLAVLDVDLSGDFSQGDGLFLMGVTDELAFEYRQDGIVLVDDWSKTELQVALRRFAKESDLIQAVAERNASAESLSDTLERQAPVVRQAQQVVFPKR